MTKLFTKNSEFEILDRKLTNWKKNHGRYLHMKFESILTWGFKEEVEKCKVDTAAEQSVNMNRLTLSTAKVKKFIQVRPYEIEILLLIEMILFFTISIICNIMDSLMRVSRM